MAKGQQNVLTWFYLLTAQAMLIFVSQAVIGYMTGSLELKSDLAHSGIDMVTYGFNAATEWMKVYSLATGMLFLQAHVIDEVGSFISVSILLVMMVFVVTDVWAKMSDPVERANLDIRAQNGDMGAAMMLFSLMTLLSNGAMLWLYKSWNLDFTASNDSAAEQDDLLGGSPINREEAKVAEWAAVDWIHGLLHPGCNGKICGDLEKLSARDEALVNLNMGAAMLHLVTDVLRTITVLVSGIFLNIHVGAAWAIDGYGSLFIAFLNILGAGTLGIKAIKAFTKTEQVF